MNNVKSIPQKIAQGNIADITSFAQLKSEDIGKYIDYNKSTAALHDFYAGQTGLKMKEMIPQQEFIKTLKRIELVDFHKDRETMIEHWIWQPKIRANFDIFYRNFRDRTCQNISKRYSIPDPPPPYTILKQKTTVPQHYTT